MSEYMQELAAATKKISRKHVMEVIQVVMDAYRNERKIFILGNGGAAAIASHFACDLGKNTLARVYDKKERRFQVISLTDNVALLTAFSNDLSFDDIFIQQLRNLISPGDIVIGISGSGNSKNVIKAMKYAKQCDAKTIGLLGFKTGGKLADIVDIKVVVQSVNYGVIEDIFLSIEHIIVWSISHIKEMHDNDHS